MNWTDFALLYYIFINLVAYCLCWYDKRVSPKQRVELRVPEKRLLALAVFGGAFGLYAAMLRFRHKTKHKNFMILVPLLGLSHIYLLCRIFGFLPPPPG